MFQQTKLAIVGRPNVGKSALFNRICKRRKAIVDDAEGITRDRLYQETDVFGTKIQVIDTGGIRFHSKAPFMEEIRLQAEIAIAEADTIVMVVDARVGVTDLDLDLARVLLKSKKPLCLAINKVDNEKQKELVHTFHILGISQMIPVSAIQGYQIAELLEMALEDVPEKTSEGLENNAHAITIVGKPNVGKSSLVNELLEEKRCIVSPIPGTTRDAIDTPIIFEGEEFLLIDTAGIRRKHKEKEVVDKFAHLRTEKAIAKATVCLLMLDCNEGFTVQDKKIANLIEEEGKGCIVLLNKWDLVKGEQMEHYLRAIEEEAPFLKHCPKLFISAKTGRNLEKIFPLVKEVQIEAEKRVTTHQLNKCIEGAIQRNHPPHDPRASP